MFAENPKNILSLTVLNTIVDVATFHRPWMMEPFAVPVLDRLWLAPMNTPMLLVLMRHAGMLDTPTRDEIMAYGALLKRSDGGRAFLKMMRGFERTGAYEDRIKGALGARDFPAQVVWGRDDPTLTLAHYGQKAAAALGLDAIHEVRGKHFVQEDSYAEIAEKVAEIAGG